MATHKRAKRSSSGQPATRANAEQSSAPATPATGPTISVPATPATGPTISVPAQPLPTAPRADSPSTGTRSPDSPAAERAAMAKRRNMIIGGATALALLIAFVSYRALTSQAPAAPALTAAPTALAAPIAAAPAAAPTAASAPIAAAPIPATAQPAAPIAATAQPAAPIAATAQPAAPIAATVQPAAAAPGTGLTCNTITGLPLFAGATCVDQDSDQDDGVIKLKNTYTAGASADEIRRFYESMFASNGWTLGDFTYDLNLGQRRAKIDVDTDQGPSGVVTQVRLTEYLAAAPASTTCAPIAGLPTFPNAACIKFNIDQDDGAFKAEHTYSTNASPEEVRRFYESALTQHGWAGPDFQYDLHQGLRRLQVDVETKQAAQGSFTEFSIAEK